jgi:hypothetical protein
VYSSPEIDPNGMYRISGYRGTVRFVEITQGESVIMSGSMAEDRRRQLTLTYGLDDLKIDDTGYFSVVLSGQRPDAYRGDWWFLDPKATWLLMRRCSCNWNREVDARVAISRLDQDSVDMSPEEISRRFSEMAALIEG